MKSQKDLLALLTEPQTPDEAAYLIVNELLPDLPLELQDRVKEAISEWGSAWGELISRVG